jgi:hypothetical protein
MQKCIHKEKLIAATAVCTAGAGAHTTIHCYASAATALEGCCQNPISKPPIVAMMYREVDFVDVEKGEKAKNY